MGESGGVGESVEERPLARNRLCLSQSNLLSIMLDAQQRRATDSRALSLRRYTYNGPNSEYPPPLPYAVA